MEKYNGKQDKIKRNDFSSVSLFFFTTSFIGWLFETIVCFILDKRFTDRGFLIMPICPVYGLPITLTYLFVGIPKDSFLMRIFEKIKLKTEEGKRWRFLGCCIVYALLAACIATFFELMAGIILKEIDAVMWDYSSFSFNYNGHVCFAISFIWGVLLTIAMLTFIKPLYLSILKINKKIRNVLSVFLLGFLLFDIVFNLYYISIYQTRYELIFAHLRIL